ncbi:MAG: hypothetical protein AAF772_20915, partial [Acidobacteriota bacterium]
GRRGGWRSAGGAAARVQAGIWRRLPAIAPAADALERELLTKERVRLLLLRYGLLCRPLLQRELPGLRWGDVFRTLRLMELGGELLAGHFFAGIPGLQFIAHGAFKRLRAGLPADAIYWLHAQDPASLCGVRFGPRPLSDGEGDGNPPPAEDALPARRSGTYLTYHGARLVLVAHAKGRRLEPRVPPDHPELASYFGALAHLLTRAIAPLTAVTVETIAGEDARRSPYRAALATRFRVTAEARGIRLWKRYASALAPADADASDAADEAPSLAGARDAAAANAERARER